MLFCGVQTTSTEGVLFYGRQQYPVYSHLAVSLTNATLHVSVVFAHPVSFNELYVTLGNALDDDRCAFTTVAIVSDTFDYVQKRESSVCVDFSNTMNILYNSCYNQLSQ